MTDSWILTLILGTLIGGVAAYLGSLMITKRMALVGDALGHVALPGMGLAVQLHVDPSLGAFVFLALGILLIWKLSEVIPLSLETLVGIIFVSSLALGFLIVPEPELLESLIGDISKIRAADAVIAFLISIPVFLIVRRIYPGMMLLNISEELAAVEGISAKKLNFLYLFAIALMVSIGIKVTGSLLVGALVIIPPATARTISTHLRQYVRNSIWVGAFSSFVGILVSHATRFPAGPSIILVNAGFLLVMLFVRKVGRNSAALALGALAR